MALLHLDKQQRGKTNPGCFAFLADHYIEHELGKKAETSQSLHKGIIRRYLNPRFGKQAALVVTPLEIEDFLEELKERGLANPTRSKIRAVMGRVYRHSQKHGLISRDEVSTRSTSLLVNQAASTNRSRSPRSKRRKCWRTLRRCRRR